MTSPTSSKLDAIAMSSVSDGWAVGALGTAVHWDGSSWTLVKSER